MIYFHYGMEKKIIHTSGRKDHPRALTRVLKSRGFKPLLLESRIVFILIVFMGFRVTLELFISIPFFPNSIFKGICLIKLNFVPVGLR
jgi:hypothetical protein